MLEAGERLAGVDLNVTPGWSAEGTITGLRGNESVEISVKDSDRRVLFNKWFGNGAYAIHGVS